MTKTEQFEAELKALLKKYGASVFSDIVEGDDGWQKAKVTFWSWSENPRDRIDFTVELMDGE